MTWAYTDGGDKNPPGQIANLTAIGPAGDVSPQNGQHWYYCLTDSVRSLTLYWAGDHFNGCKITFYDGSADQGSEYNPGLNGSSNPQTINLNRGEKINKIEVRSDGVVKYILICTDQGQSVQFGDINCTGSQTVWSSTNLGTGILQGLFGHEGTWLNSVGFIFSKSIMSEELTDFNWHIDRSELASDQVVAVQSAVATNRSSVQQQNLMNLGVTVTESRDWSRTDGRTFGQKLTVSCEFSGSIGKAGASLELSFEESYTDTKGGSISRSINYGDTVQVNVPPHSQIKASAMMRESKYTIPFDAMWTKTMSDGSVDSTRVYGSLAGVAYQDYVVSYGPDTPIPADHS